MPREVSAPSKFRSGKPVKSSIGGSFTHYRTGGRWDKSGGTPTGKVIGRTKQAKWQDDINGRSEVLLSGLSSSSKQTLDDVRSQQPTHSSEIPGNDGVWADVDDEEPMDDEIEVSGEGEEIHILQEKSRRRKYGAKDARTWTQRINTSEKKWALQISLLADAYLAWKHGTSTLKTTNEGFTVQYVDVFDFQQSKPFSHIQERGSGYWNVTLLRHGCLSPTPDVISTVFSLRTLELYRRLRLRHPQLSMQAFVKVICDLNGMVYIRQLWHSLTDAFDVYLMILRHVDKMTETALGRTGANYRLLHSCPSCQYKLEDEPPLEISLMGALDGNQSLKRADVRAGAQEDPRRFHSSYHLSEEDVDVFKYDIKPRADKSSKEKAKTAEEAGAADGDINNTTCTDRWKAAAADVLKRMWQIYRESGIFLAACRHGLIWIFCDMIRSGELAKYPLAIVNQLLSVFGKDLGLGYDIACSFSATVKKSSIAASAAELQLRLCVPSFHGFAHNRWCQLHNHPLYLRCFGIEDLEICERIFSASNGCAKLTRHATRFHRLQFLDMHFKQWDEDKYAELSNFLLNNYKQVSSILTELPTTIADLQSGKSMENTAYAAHLDAERAYLASLKKEPEAHVFGCQYITMLLKYSTADKLYTTSLMRMHLQKTQEARLALQKVIVDAYSQVEHLRDTLTALERLHGVTERWLPSTPEWKEAEAYMEVRNYQRALDKLEGLVVQRLFELTKMGLAGTGYKMRVHINKALKTRCKAIQTALKKYNAAASALGRPPLDWKNISTYGSLAEFTLLRECRSDIRRQPWAEASNRQAAVYDLKIQGAVVEQIRLNLEVRRLATFMHHEEEDFAKALADARPVNADLAAELEHILTRRLQVNKVHRARIALIHALPAFDGLKTLGQRAGRASTAHAAVRDTEMVDESGANRTDEPHDDTDSDEDDEVQTDNVDNYIQYVGNLARGPDE